MYSFLATLKAGTQPDVVTLSDAKDHLNITHTYQDTLIQAYIDAAINYAENYTSRSLKIHEVTATAAAFCETITLEKTPYSSGLVIQYYNTNNALQTLAASTYVINYVNDEPVIVFNEFENLPEVYNRKDAVKITYEAGYEDEALIPKSYKQAIKLLLGQLYENRTDTVDKLPRCMNTLLRPYKKWD